MFNIGGGEFLVIALIALIVLGPTRLPDAARQIGKAMGELRRMSNGFQSELRDAFADSETAASTVPPRDALAVPPARSAPVTDAVAAVSKQAPTRRAPLRAAPLDAVEPAAGAPVNGSRARKAPAAPRKAAAAPRKSGAAPRKPRPTGGS